MIVSFWVHLKARPNYNILQNLYWPPMLQYITTNYTSGCILVFRTSTQPYFVGPVKYLQRYIISYVLTKCVNLTMYMYHISMFWFIRKCLVQALERVNVKVLSTSTPFLGGMYYYLYYVIKTIGCYWPMV